MARSFNGSTQYIDLPNPPWGTGTQYSMAAWVRPTANSGTFFCRENDIHGNPIYFELNLQSGTARFLVRDESGNSAFSTKASAYNSGVWTHFGGVRNGNDTLVYVDGVAGTIATGSLGTISVNDPANDNGAIAARTLGSTSPTVLLTGDEAEVAYWDTNLTAAEMLSLARGFSPRKVRPGNLVFHAPLIRSSLDFVGALSLTDIATPGVAAHPRIYR